MAKKSESVPVAEVVLPASERKYDSRRHEVLQQVRDAILKAPDGTLVVSVEVQATQ